MKYLVALLLCLVQFTFAEEPAVAQNTAGFLKGWGSYIPMVLVFAVFYFVIIRPQNRKQQELELMIKSVRCGDQILTRSGIYGSVSEYSESEPYFKLEVSKGVALKILKTSIAKVESVSR